MKKCSVCGEEKDLECFYKHPKMADGRLNRCKDCHRAAITANRNANIDRYRQYDLSRAKRSGRKAEAVRQTKEWRACDSRRTAAHNAVARAIRTGSIVKRPCERCGETHSYAHHDNYDHKLDVVWLCQPCHKQRHKEMVIAGIEP